MSMTKRFLLALAFLAAATPSFAQGDFVVNYRGLVAGRPALTNGFVTLYRSEHSFYLALESSPSASASWTLRLPVSAGSSGECLKTNGTGITSWASCYTLSGALLTANNLSELTATASTARTNLGLGTLATQSGTFSGTSSGTNTGDVIGSTTQIPWNNAGTMTGDAHMTRNAAGAVQFGDATVTGTTVPITIHRGSGTGNYLTMTDAIGVDHFRFTSAATAGTLSIGYAAATIQTVNGSGPITVLSGGYTDALIASGGIRVTNGGYNFMTRPYIFGVLPVSSINYSVAGTYTDFGTARFDVLNTTANAGQAIVITDAATALIDGPPTGSGGVTITNPHALLVKAGMSTFKGGVRWGTGTRPTCNAAARGTTWYVAGGAGVADTFELCRKDAADAYAWVTLF